MKQVAPRAPVVTTASTDVIFMIDVTLLQSFVQGDGSVAGPFLQRSLTDEKIIHFGVDVRIVQEVRIDLLRIYVAGTENAKGGE